MLNCWRTSLDQIGYPNYLSDLKKKRVHYFTIFASPTPTPQPPKKTKRPTGFDGLLSNVVLFKGRILNRCLALVFNVCLRFCLPDLIQSHYISIDDLRTCVKTEKGFLPLGAIEEWNLEVTSVKARAMIKMCHLLWYMAGVGFFLGE